MLHATTVKTSKFHPFGEPPRPYWRALRLLNLYRVGLALFLLFLAGTEQGPEVLAKLSHELFYITLVAYIALGIGGYGLARVQQPSFIVQVVVEGVFEIAALVLLMMASGGVSSGLGMLLLIAVAGNALVTPGRTAIFFAALGTLALLTAEIFGQLWQLYETSYYTHTGILGATLFVSASVAAVLGRRAQQSEALAVKRGLDLANMAELNQHIVSTLDSGIIVIDDADQVHLTNEAALRLLGYPKEKPQQRPKAAPPNLRAALAGWRQAGCPQGYTVQLPGTANTTLRMRLTRLGETPLGASLIFLEDIAELQHQIQQTKLASLGRLTASIAHEIRNPLAAITHAGQLLAESSDLNDADQRLVRMILDHGQRMNGIVGNILQLSRRGEPRCDHIDLGQWLARFLEDFRQHKKLAPEIIQTAQMPPGLRIQFDSDQLHQVIWNLLSNAVKYGRDASGELQIRLQARRNDNNGAIELVIIDSGPGIAPEYQDRLFEPFFTTASDSTGLGLYLARELCVANGAELTYRSDADLGSLFRLTFTVPNHE